jgi:endoglucanase
MVVAMTLALLVAASGCASASPRRDPPRKQAPARNTAPPPRATPAATTAYPPLRVRGNRLVDGRGRRVRLLGVNRNSAEYMCFRNPLSDGLRRVFDGPVNDKAVAAMRAWHINAVRIPLNESCWLGLGGVDPNVGGIKYQDAIAAYVQRLHKAGMYAILSLVATAPGTKPAVSIQRMADADHAPDFWRSVATRFLGDRAVLFDLFNEPHEISWRCWLRGCRVPGVGRSAGMQQLVDAVRSTGARQPILLAGNNFANDLSEWLKYMPHDPRHQLVASVHVYNFSLERDAALWGLVLQPLAKRVPLVASELGENDCRHDFIDFFMKWADANNVSYLGWAWSHRSGFQCSLIKNYAGTPTAFGIGLRDHLARLARR